MKSRQRQLYKKNPENVNISLPLVRTCVYALGHYGPVVGLFVSSTNIKNRYELIEVIEINTYFSFRCLTAVFILY